MFFEYFSCLVQNPQNFKEKNAKNCKKLQKPAKKKRAQERLRHCNEEGIAVFWPWVFNVYIVAIN